MDISEMLVLMGFVGACLLAAATGASFPPGDWYQRLAKPSWRPPNWLFGPAWAVLYLTIAVRGRGTMMQGGPFARATINESSAPFDVHGQHVDTLACPERGIATAAPGNETSEARQVKWRVLASKNSAW